MALGPFQFNLRHLRAVVAIAEQGGMGAAAQAVGLSQPALTQGIAKLERQLGVRLFDRRPDGLRATDEGRALADRARAALAYLADAARPTTRGSARGFARPDMLMTATQLHALLALVEAGSFVGASVQTGVTQPALHRAVRDLEQLCGQPLAIRSGRSLTMTAAGRRLARGIRLAAGELAAAIAELSPDLDASTPIRIGAMPLSRARLIPAAVAALIREGARAALDVREGSWRELVDPLRDGAIDLMVGALREAPPAGLHQRALFDDSLIIVARAGHPLAELTAPSLDDYRRFGWIIGQPETPLRAHWLALFEGGALPPAPLECGSVMVIRGVLRETDLLTLLSIDQVAVEMASGLLVQIGPPLPKGQRTIGVTTREGWRPTAIQQRFLDLLDAAVDRTRLQESE